MKTTNKKANQDQDEIARILADKTYAVSKTVTSIPALKGTVSRFDDMGIKLLRNFMDPKTKTELTDQDKNFLVEFLSKSIANKELNKFLTANMEHLTSSEKWLRTFTFKTRHFKLAQDAGNKYTRKEHLTLPECGALYDLANIDLGIPKGLILAVKEDKESELYALSELQLASKAFIKEYTSQIGTELNELDSSVIIVDKTNKQKALGWLNNFWLRFISNFTNKVHTSLLSRAKDSKTIKETHFYYGSLHTAEYNLDTSLYRDFYKLDITKLITPETLAILERTLGPEYIQQLNAKYKEIELKVQNQAVMAKDKFKISTTSVIKSILLGLLPFGHKKFQANDYKKIATMFLSNDGATQNVLCSEITANIMIASIVTLNQNIQADLKSKNCTLDKDIVRMPLGKHENLTTLTPDRLMSQLKKSGCLEKYRPLAKTQLLAPKKPIKPRESESLARNSAKGI